MLEDLLSALQLRDWYALAALLITIIIQALRKWPALRDRIWARIPDGWRFAVPMLSGAAVAFVAAYSDGQPLSAALAAAVGGALTIGLGSMGAAAALKESPVPWDGRAGGRRPVTADDIDTRPTPKPPHIHLMMLVLAFALSGCGLLSGAESAELCSFENAAYSARVLECDQQIGQCPKRDDGTPREDCPALIECERWLSEVCE